MQGSGFVTIRTAGRRLRRRDLETKMGRSSLLQHDRCGRSDHQRQRKVSLLLENMAPTEDLQWVSGRRSRPTLKAPRTFGGRHSPLPDWAGERIFVALNPSRFLASDAALAKRRCRAPRVEGGLRDEEKPNPAEAASDGLTLLQIMQCAGRPRPDTAFRRTPRDDLGPRPDSLFCIANIVGGPNRTEGILNRAQTDHQIPTIVQRITRSTD